MLPWTVTFTSTCVHCFVVSVQIEKLRLAAEMLPPNDSYQKAARLVEQAMQVGLAVAALPMSCIWWSYESCFYYIRSLCC